MGNITVRGHTTVQTTAKRCKNHDPFPHLICVYDFSYQSVVYEKWIRTINTQVTTMLTFDYILIYIYSRKVLLIIKIILVIQKISSSFPTYAILYIQIQNTIAYMDTAKLIDQSIRLKLNGRQGDRTQWKQALLLVVHWVLDYRFCYIQTYAAYLFEIWIKYIFIISVEEKQHF